MSAADTGFAKVSRRIFPLALGLYVLSYLDRVNLAFAAPTMTVDLGFDAQIYGLAAGLFFISYALFEVPSALAARRFGTRVWLARIMITWGVIAILTGFVQNEGQLFAARFLLGLAEAGAFPILLSYVSSWAPGPRRARAFAVFLASLPIAGAIGGPLSGLLLSLDGVLGLQGWQWLFIVEGLPAVIAGIWVLRRLPESPSTVAWLTPREAEAVTAELAAQEQQRADHHLSSTSIAEAARNPLVWLLGVTLMLTAIGFYSLSFWLPLVSSMTFTGLAQWQLGLVNGAPFVVAAITMLLVARSADHRRETRWHGMTAMLIGGAALALTAWAGGLGAFVLLAVALSCAFAGGAVMWLTPTAFLRGAAAATGIALINTIGALGGFIGPFLLGTLTMHYPLTTAFLAIGAALVGAGTLFFVIATRARPR